MCPSQILLLHNHGALCCGETVEEAFFNVYNTVLACETQIKLMPIGVDNLVLVNDETRKQVYDAAHRAPEGDGDKKTKHFRIGELEFEALIRMLDNAVSHCQINIFRLNLSGDIKISSRDQGDFFKCTLIQFTMN